MGRGAKSSHDCRSNGQAFHMRLLVARLAFQLNDSILPRVRKECISTACYSMANTEVYSQLAESQRCVGPWVSSSGSQMTLSSEIPKTSMNARLTDILIFCMSMMVSHVLQYAMVPHVAHRTYRTLRRLNHSRLIYWLAIFKGTVFHRLRCECRPSHFFAAVEQ